MNTQRSVERYAKGIDDRIDAERYRKLRAWLIARKAFIEQADVYTSGTFLRGPTFDAAVDALPEPQTKKYHLCDPDLCAYPQSCGLCGYDALLDRLPEPGTSHEAEG